MKKIKIISFVMILAAALSFIFSVSTFAIAEEGEIDSTASPALNSTDEESDGNVFEGIVAALEDYASEILSALAFIGSVIIMLAYKKGLIPVINDGLRALKSGVKSINEKSDSFNEHAIAVCDGIDERLKRAEKLSEDLLKSNELVEKRLSELSSNAKERERLSIILASQIDMLYEIFMSAGLPQYLKDSVGEKISQMRSALGKEEKNDALV